MYCKNCGAQLDDTSRFCYVCGAQMTEKKPTGTPNTKHRYERPACSPNASKKKKKKGLITLIAIIAAVAVLAVGVAALVFSGVFGSDSVKVAAAIAKSTKAFTDASDKMALTDVASIVETKKFNQEYALWIEELDGYSNLSGLGVRMALDSDLPGRNICMAVTPFWGSADLVTLQTKLYDSEIYVGSPELTEGTFYMINTETIFSDLNNLGIDMGEAADLSINIFDGIDSFQELTANNEELNKAIKEGATELLKEVEITKSGAETIDVNGAALNCTVYDVMFPQVALYNYLNTIENAYVAANNTDSYGQMLESMGLPADVVAEMMANIEDPAVYIDEAFDEIYNTLDNLGDVHLSLYLNDGYVVSAVYQNIFDGVQVALVLTVGGGTNYVDNISFHCIADEEEYRITSTGNHAGTNDVFTDVTVFEYVDDGQVTPLIQLDSSYAPKQVEDNFSFKVKADSASLDLQGQLTCDKESMNLNLNKVAVYNYSSKLAVFGLEYSIGKYDGDSFSVNNYHALAGMTKLELMSLAQELAANATNWAQNLDSDIQNKLTGIAGNFY